MMAITTSSSISVKPRRRGVSWQSSEVPRVSRSGWRAGQKSAVMTSPSLIRQRRIQLVASML